MVVYRLDERLVFPPPEEAEDGLLAVGGDLRPQRLLLAYAMGIFPWYGEDDPILWHSPDPRCVLPLDGMHVSRSLARTLRRGTYRVTLDREFAAVIDACAQAPRPGQGGTWITPEMRDAYVEMHRLGVAHSVETWRAGELVGGMYGISLGAVFFGESMFSSATDASKVALATLVAQLRRWEFELFDCQVASEHIERLGAVEWPRARFLEALTEALTKPTRRGRWTLEI